VHLETLQTFCDLLDSGSFSKAAQQNRVSQSAVSQQLKTLESRFGRRLIERGQGQRLAPTEAGRALYVESKAILERFTSLEHRIKHHTQLVSGTLRVATVYSVGLHALPPYVKQFLRAHPQVNVRVEYSRTDKIYDACLDGSIDLGIVAQPLRRAQIEVIPLKPERLVLVCSPEHALAQKRSVPLARIAGEAFVAFDRGVPTRKAIDRLLKEHGVAVNLVTEFDNIETIKRSVEAGLGISILPENTVLNEKRAGLIASVTFSDGPFVRSVGIIHRKGRELSPAARAFEKLVAGG
jgi:DNA-binding transcriptional LysR family regulator